jgi:hypothetical protein
MWLDRIIEGAAKLYKKKRKWFMVLPITFDVEESQDEMREVVECLDRPAHMCVADFVTSLTLLLSEITIIGNR